MVSAYKGWSKNVGDLQGLLDPGESPLGVCAHGMLFPRPRTRDLSVLLGRQTTHTILIFYPKPEGDQDAIELRLLCAVNYSFMEGSVYCGCLGAGHG